MINNNYDSLSFTENDVVFRKILKIFRPIYIAPVLALMFKKLMR